MVDFGVGLPYTESVEAMGTGRFYSPQFCFSQSTLEGKVPSVCGLTSRPSPRQRPAASGGHFAMSRKQRHHISDGQRERIFAMTAGACFYCGYAATCLDHIVPHSYVANDTDDNLVPACDICNRIASNQHFPSLQAKKEYILAERASAKWQNRIARMVVTVVQPPLIEPAKSPKPKALRTARPPKTSKPKPKPLSRSKSTAPAPRTNAQAAEQEPTWQYVEDAPDYIQGLVDELIEHADAMTDDQIDTLMSVLIGQHKSAVGLKAAEAIYPGGPDAIQRHNQRPVVYGRDEFGQITEIVL